MVIAVFLQSLSVGTDPSPRDEELTMPFPNRVRVCSLPYGTPNLEFGERDPDCPPEKLDETGDTGGVSLGVTSAERLDGIPKFPATLQLPAACLYIPCGSCGNVVGIVATAFLHFLGGGWRENVNEPGGEK